MKKRIFFIIVFVLVMAPVAVFASGVVAQQQRMKGQSPEQMQQIMQQKLEIQQETHEQLLERQVLEGSADEEMDFDELWEQLAVSSEVWKHLVDREIKALIVETYIDWYKEKGIIIRKPSLDYMLFIDAMALQGADLFGQPFATLLMTAAVMEYDFDNGMNKDQLARDILGPQLYEFNRKRLGGM